ncbi:MAG: CPBP family intramembrane metalloprotease [Clostridiales bacterium]|nr:CPBP family intramembrane metalloprotease [Clostridiales bacterium]
MQIKLKQDQDIYVKPKWKIWPGFLILFISFVIGVIPFLFENSVQRPSGFLILLNVLQFACFFLIPLYVAGVLYKQPLQALGIQARFLTRGVGKALQWGFMLWLLNVLAAIILQVIFPNQPQDMQMLMQAMLEESNAFELGGLIFCVTVLAPIGEEIFFRAFLFGALEARFGTLVGIIISAAVFGILHETIWNFFPLFVGGCGFALLYAKYRDISMNIVAHATWNSISVILMLTMLKGS